MVPFTEQCHFNETLTILTHSCFQNSPMPIQPREELIWLPRTLDPDDPNVEVCAQFQFLITMITTMVALLGQNCHDLQGQRSMPVLDVQFSPIHDAIPAQQCRGQKRMWFSIFFQVCMIAMYVGVAVFPYHLAMAAKMTLTMMKGMRGSRK